MPISCKNTAFHPIKTHQSYDETQSAWVGLTFYAFVTGYISSCCPVDNHLHICQAFHFQLPMASIYCTCTIRGRERINESTSLQPLQARAALTVSSNLPCAPALWLEYFPSQREMTPLRICAVRLDTKNKVKWIMYFSGTIICDAVSCGNTYHSKSSVTTVLGCNGFKLSLSLAIQNFLWEHGEAFLRLLTSGVADYHISAVSQS